MRANKAQGAKCRYGWAVWNTRSKDDDKKGENYFYPLLITEPAGGQISLQKNKNKLSVTVMINKGSFLWVEITEV